MDMMNAGTSTEQSYQPEVPVFDELWAARQCREALACIERAQKAGPIQLGQEAGSAAQILYRLRALCASCWQDGSFRKNLAAIDEIQALLRKATDPLQDGRRKALQQAAGYLQELLEAGWH